jgi:cell pole-organizing protein PopZ
MENDVSTQPKDQEPSMEEILSSIRRIIADEETEDAKPDEELDRASAARDASELDTLGVLDDDDDDDDDDADDISDVLELTSVVDDDGGIVELDSGFSGPAPLELVDDSDDDQDEIEIDDFTDEEHGEVEQELTLPEIDLTSLEDNEPDPEPDHTMPVNMIHATSLQEDEPAVSTKKAESEALLSTGTASTTTGAFAKLTKAFRPTPVEESVADGAGRTDEQFIEDMARPMLKEWLDENMPAIVESVAHSS